MRQRVRLRFHLSALTEPEMGAYIRHRLGVAGAEDREIFEPDTFPLIFRYTGGIPRLTNTLCDTCLLSAFGSDLETVDVEIVRQALGELQWQEYAGAHAHRPAGDPHRRYRAATAPAGGPASCSRMQGVKIDHALLVPGRFIVGRTTDNDMQIDSKFVSRHHMQLVTTADNCYVEDLNSTNGVFLNGKRVRRHKLQAGDVIKLGHARNHLLARWTCQSSQATTPARRGRRCCRIPRTDWIRRRRVGDRRRRRRTSRPIRRLRADRNPPAWRGNRAASSTATPPR